MKFNTNSECEHSYSCYDEDKNCSICVPIFCENNVVAFSVASSESYSDMDELETQVNNNSRLLASSPEMFEIISNLYEEDVFDNDVDMKNKVKLLLDYIKG